MEVIVYSTGCPKCTVLEKKLNEKNIPFQVVSDVEVMQEKGFTSMPMLEVNNVVMDFGAGIKWVNGA